MKPDPTRVLETAAASLLLELGPRLPAAYEQASAGITGLLLAAAREEFDRAAARRVEENAALRQLFADAARVVEEAPLRERLAAAAAGADASLLVPALDAANHELRGLLIELHAHVESLAGEAARALEEAIWAELRRSTERRRLSLGIF